MGRLACSLARQCKADFTTISASQLSEAFPNLQDTQYLLFVTHPLREVGNHTSASTDSYLTFYAFSSDLSQSSTALPWHTSYTIRSPVLLKKNLGDRVVLINRGKGCNPQGVSAKDVYQMISLLEEDALRPGSPSLETAVFEVAKDASKKLALWLEQSRKIGGLTKKSYFLPIPVALVALLR